MYCVVGGTFVDVIVAPQFGILGFLIMVGAIVLMWSEIEQEGKNRILPNAITL